MDAARRNMVHAAVEQKRISEERGRKGVMWMKEREAHHGWMWVVLRAWREAAEHGEKVKVKEWRIRKRGDAKPSTKLRLASVAGTEEHGASSKGHATRSAGRKADATAAAATRRDGETDDVLEILFVKVRGMVLRVDVDRWRDLLSDKIRALGTWARVMRIREKVKACARWRAAGEHVMADIRKRKEEERKKRAEREQREQRERERSDAKRSSGRLGELKAKGYSETRKYVRRQGEEKRRRRAMAAQHGARVGVRMWWWMEEGEGWDATGPQSVRRGRHEDKGTPTRTKPRRDDARRGDPG